MEVHVDPNPHMVENHPTGGSEVDILEHLKIIQFPALTPHERAQSASIPKGRLGQLKLHTSFVIRCFLLLCD